MSVLRIENVFPGAVPLEGWLSAFERQARGAVVCASVCREPHGQAFLRRLRAIGLATIKDFSTLGATPTMGQSALADAWKCAASGASLRLIYLCISHVEVTTQGFVEASCFAHQQLARELNQPGELDAKLDPGDLEMSSLRRWYALGERHQTFGDPCELTRSLIGTFFSAADLQLEATRPVGGEYLLLSGVHLACDAGDQVWFPRGREG